MNSYSRRNESMIRAELRTELLSLDKICELANKPRSRNAFGKSQGPVDAIKTIFWYRGLANRIKANSPYALGKILEPDGYRVVGEAGSRIYIHRNKWVRYARGESVPQSKLVLKIEDAYENSAAEISHPLWRLLERPPSSRVEFEMLLKNFRPDVQLKIREIRQILIFPMDHDVVIRGEHLKDLSAIDALGALLYLLHERNASGRWGISSFVKNIYLLIMVRGQEFYERGVLRSLYEMLQETILNRVVDDGCALVYPWPYFFRALKIFNSCRRDFCANHHGQCRKNKLKHFNKYFYLGDFGEHLRTLARPVGRISAHVEGKGLAATSSESRKIYLKALLASSRGEYGRRTSTEFTPKISCTCRP